MAVAVKVFPRFGENSPRARLAELIAERREDMAGLSRLLGRNPAYIQQYLRRGTPRRLHEEDRRSLARYFNVDERELGAIDPLAPLDALAGSRHDRHRGRMSMGEVVQFPAAERPDLTEAQREMISLLGGDPDRCEIAVMRGFDRGTGKVSELRYPSLEWRGQVRIIMPDGDVFTRANIEPAQR